MRHFLFFILILFFLYFHGYIMLAQGEFIGIDIFGELSGGCQNYS